MADRGNADTVGRVDTGTFRREVGGALAVAAVTAGWLAGLGLLAWKVFGISITADEGDDSSRRLAQVLLTISAVLVGGPVVVAGIARALRLGGVARWYLGLALIMVLPAAYGVLIGWRGLQQPEPSEPWTPSTHCVAYSGGSNNCPGG